MEGRRSQCLDGEDEAGVEEQGYSFVPNEVGCFLLTRRSSPSLILPTQRMGKLVYKMLT